MPRLAAAFLAILGLALGCSEGDESPSPSAGAPRSVTAANAATPSSPATAPQIVVRDAAGAEALSIRDDDGVVTVRYAEGTTPHELVGTPRDTGKRKYTLDGSAVLFEIKPGEKGFKLRDAAGKLQWKVRAAPDKIKVSDNEQNENAFELKIREDGVKVVAPGDRLLGRLRSEGREMVLTDAKSQEAFRIAAPVSAAYGVLLLNDIPAPQRYILLAELVVGEGE